MCIQAPICVTDTTPFDCILEMFGKIGARQVLVTRNGYCCNTICDTHLSPSCSQLIGIITRKDALHFRPSPAVTRNARNM
jgi:hypothetical protein